MDGRMEREMIASFTVLCLNQEKILNQLVAMVITMCAAGEAVKRLFVFYF